MENFSGAWAFGHRATEIWQNSRGSTLNREAWPGGSRGAGWIGGLCGLGLCPSDDVAYRPTKWRNSENACDVWNSIDKSFANRQGVIPEPRGRAGRTHSFVGCYALELWLSIRRVYESGGSVGVAK
jgi:hypothetical protein